ncbi:HtaA domain-containing protein [Leucobacter sp. CSA2]|uniref:HtaA domain-containing protein n=1 Tax=Leucobacter edaphi TaxID=2796472 RepID=A0A934UW08_9MICO|nr:HtaA domain-containing protein [Leucobacter edaphi]MBK0420470.1 HtaA domain-containing protein [Leucobacter edaphi]
MRNRTVTGNRLRAAATGIGALALLGGLLAAPAAATAAPASATPTRAVTAEATGECTAEAGTLTWGVKESFRSYISGSIANGKWTVSDDMKYETPNFIWNKIAGGFDPRLESGRLSFTGAVDFTGHDGAMKLDIANPAIEFAGDDTAYLLLTIGSTDKANTGGAAAAKEVRAAKIELAGTVTAGEGALSVAKAPARLTSDGAAAFNGEYGSYAAGDELDPITLAVTAGGCTIGAQEASPSAPPATEGNGSSEGALADTAKQQTQPFPWVPVVVGGVALLVIGVTAGMLIAGRKRPSAETHPVSDDGTSSDQQERPEHPGGPLA